jgi:hypothetical protein
MKSYIPIVTCHAIRGGERKSELPPEASRARVGPAKVLPHIRISGSTTLAPFESRLTAERIATQRRRILCGAIRRLADGATTPLIPEIATAAYDARIQRHK